MLLNSDGCARSANDRAFFLQFGAVVGETLVDHKQKGNVLQIIPFASIVFALVVAVLVLIRERRMRLALQLILRRLISKWRACENTQVDDCDSHRNADFGERRM